MNCGARNGKSRRRPASGKMIQNTECPVRVTSPSSTMAVTSGSGTSGCGNYNHGPFFGPKFTRFLPAEAGVQPCLSMRNRLRPHYSGWFLHYLCITLPCLYGRLHSRRKQKPDHGGKNRFHFFKLLCYVVG